MSGSPSSGGVTTLRGTVTARKFQTYGGGSGKSVYVHSVPEIWVRDDAGKELYFRGHEFEACREGHEIVLVHASDDGRFLGLSNLSMGETRYSPSLDNQSLNAFLLLMIMLATVFFFIVAWIVSVLVFGDVWERRTWLARTGPELLSLLALGLGVWLPVRWKLRHNQRCDALRARVDTAIKAAAR